ncbi:MAG: thioesterase [Deltaproteobacteria bacterium]|nr:thioesterase [Deltaproteobacteria bacterium]
MPRRLFRPRARVFCFPYAGGSAGLFARWVERLPTDIELWAVQYPGRAERFHEPPFRQLPRLVEALGDALERLGLAATHPPSAQTQLPIWAQDAELPMGRKLEDRSGLSRVPHVFFGHSMGAVVAFELARLLRRRGRRLPEHIIVSAHRAPFLPSTHPPRHTMSKESLLRELRLLGGTNEVVLRESELMELLLPTIRADFELIESYSYTPEPPIDVPITALGGQLDPFVTKDMLESWGRETEGGFLCKMFPGGHFFLEECQSAVGELVSRSARDRGPDGVESVCP